jgi:hypothetical protein
MTPLLFAAKEMFSAEDFARVLKLVSIIAFRYTAVTGLNTNELEPISHIAASAILSGQAKTPRDLFDLLRPIYVDDERFKQAFSTLDLSTQGQKKKLVKYILCRIESDLSARDCDPDTDPGTIEHILPENPGTEWEESIPFKHWDNQVYRLGNLTLLRSSDNRDAGNDDYPRKLEKYRNSAYQITQRITEDAPSEWSIELIAARQKKMAERAVHIWRADFA